MNIWLKLFTVATPIVASALLEHLKDKSKFGHTVNNRDYENTDLSENKYMNADTLQKFLKDNKESCYPTVTTDEKTTAEKTTDEKKIYEKKEILKDDYIIKCKESYPALVEHIILTREQAYEQGWHYKRKSNGRLRITRYDGNLKNITVPSEIDGFIVNEIGKNVFLRSEIEHMHIPNTVKKIGTRAFYFSELKSVTFADGVKFILDEAFAGCKALGFVHLPRTLEKIGCSAFENCKSLRGIILPCSNVGKNAFRFSKLENISFTGGHFLVYSDFDGSALASTPLHENHRFVLFPDSSETNYDVAIIGMWIKKFPKNSFVRMGKHSVVHGCNIDFSECREVIINEESIEYRMDSRGIVWSYPVCNFIMPENSYCYFPDFVKAVYADGTKYKGIFDIEDDNNGAWIVNVHSYYLPKFSLKNHSITSLTIKSENSVRFSENTIDMFNLQTFSSDRLYGEGNLFSSLCMELHRVEFNGKITYIPNGDFNENAHKQLLKAFSGRFVDDGLEFFDSSVYRQVFCDDIDSYSDCRKQSRKKHIRLSQKDKIMLAVDVLRSSDGLFEDKDMYEKYLKTHERYAKILCDKLNDEYSGFLRGFYK